jgi:hypothetical protein
MLTDRPRGPYLILSNGRKVLADYHWEKQVPGFPDRIQVLTDEESDGRFMNVIAGIDGPFESWDEIHKLAVQAGNDHYKQA